MYLKPNLFFDLDFRQITRLPVVLDKLVNNILIRL